MKTNTKHTPGPWNVSGCRANDDNLICHGDENETSPIIAQVLSDGGALPRLANARLIAAAPELLDAAKWASTILAGYLSANSQEERNYMYKDLQHAGKTLDAAIDKATAE